MYLGYYREKTGKLNDNTTVTNTLHFDENTLYPIERSTNDTNSCTTTEVKLVRKKVAELVIIAIAHTNELLHLAIGHNDGLIMSIDGASKILYYRKLRLELAHSRLRHMHKQ